MYGPTVRLGEEERIETWRCLIERKRSSNAPSIYLLLYTRNNDIGPDRASNTIRSMRPVVTPATLRQRDIRPHYAGKTKVILPYYIAYYVPSRAGWDSASPSKIVSSQLSIFRS